MDHLKRNTIIIIICIIYIIGIYAIEFLSNNQGWKWSALVNYWISWSAFCWSGFTYFNQQKNQKDIERIKFLNQKDLETFKMYTKQKNERIVDLFGKMNDAIIFGMQMNPGAILFGHEWQKCTKEYVEEYLNRMHISDYDRKSILEWWESKVDAERSAPISQEFNQSIDNKVYIAIYNRDAAIKQNDLFQSINKAILYLPDDVNEKIDKIWKDIEILYEQSSPSSRYMDRELVAAGHESNMGKTISLSKQIHKEFKETIVPLLKRELKDFQ
jgi:hypothetical protein